MTDDVRFFMNHDEQIAYKYLCRRFEAERVVYEPNGNIPPDFVVLDGPAIEVRRLNLNNFSKPHPKAIEESTIPLTASVDKLLKGFGSSQNELSWFVILDFDFEPNDWHDVRRKHCWQS